MVLTMVTAVAMVSVLNYFMATEFTISPAPAGDRLTQLLVLLLPACAGVAMTPHVRKTLDSACIGILIGFGFFILSLYTSTVPGIEKTLDPLILHMRVFFYYTFATAMVSLFIMGGSIAGHGFLWGRDLRKKITRKGK
jgi:hypothetical protein